MVEKIKLKETNVKDTDIILWKNIAKNPDNNSYSITISKKNLVFISVSAVNRKNLTFMVAKYDSIIEWVNFLMLPENSGGA